jgi:prepilin-type processing-associated H-X9-DG protein
MKHITDGTSKTLLIGEYTNRDYRKRRSLWAYTFGCYVLSQTVYQPRVFSDSYCNAGGSDTCTNTAGSCTFTGESGTVGAPNYSTGHRVCKRGFWSYHSGGMNTVMCDGAVDFLSFDVDMLRFAAMGSIAGNETELGP